MTHAGSDGRPVPDLDGAALLDLPVSVAAALEGHVRAWQLRKQLGVDLAQQMIREALAPYEGGKAI